MVALAVLGAGFLPAVAVAAGAGDVAPPSGIPAPPTTDAVRDRAIGDARGAAGAELTGAKSTAWQRAVDEAKQPDFGKLVQPRPLALLIGVAWLVLATRSRWRMRRRRGPARA